jgi:hypothetical protein
MDSSIRIIKRQVNDKSENSQPTKEGKTARQNTSEIAMTIKGWIAERQQRRRTEERIDFRLWQADSARQGL